MLLQLFRTKDRTIAIIAILIILLIVIGICIHGNRSRRDIDQAVMAENYLKAGNYTMALKAYKDALLSKEADSEILSIGLADAYVGVKEYDEALEVLRNCYQVTSGSRVKEKIEEITAKKIDYDYLQTISIAEIYYSNKEYKKAISEYEKAKKIKSKEATPFIRIAQAYIEDGEYEQARKEALEGQELTKDSVFDSMLNEIASYQKKEKYDDIVKQAQDYSSQDNNKDGIMAYQEAIQLIPEEIAAYQGLAELYLKQQEYDKTIALLEYAKQYTKSKELDRLMKKAKEHSSSSSDD